MKRAADGDEDAIKAILKRHAPAARRAITGRIPRRWRSVLSVDDVMQQTFADAIRDISRFQGNDEMALDGWLGGLARCNLRDATRMLEAEKRGGKQKRLQPSQNSGTYRTLATMLFADGETPSRYAATDECNSLLEQAVEALPEAYRVVVNMYDLQGHEVEAVARTLDRSIGAVYMLRARAHDRLRDLLGETGNFFTDFA
ncbi:MAG: sigma-70 family RNA polymerase sigma factor [Phycisphaerae bacterium]